MSRLGRFLRLERARPDDAAHADARPPGAPQPSASLRFQAIEPRREAPAPKPNDPFAPPPDRDIPLAIAIDHAPDADDVKQKRRDRAEAELAQLAREREQLALQRQPVVAPNWMQRREVHALANLTTAGRIVVLGTAAIVIGVLAAATGPIAWGLFPIVAAVVIASAWIHST